MFFCLLPNVFCTSMRMLKTERHWSKALHGQCHLAPKGFHPFRGVYKCYTVQCMGSTWWARYCTVSDGAGLHVRVMENSAHCLNVNQRPIHVRRLRRMLYRREHKAQFSSLRWKTLNVGCFMYNIEKNMLMISACGLIVKVLLKGSTARKHITFVFMD